MGDDYTRVIERLSRVPGVRGAAVVDAHAGVPVVAEVADASEGAMIAALAASLFRMSTRSGEAAGIGALETAQLEAEGGHVIVAGAGEMLLVAVADADAQLGMIRLEASRAAEELL